MHPLLSLERLVVAHGAMPVLHGVSLAVHPGEIVTLIGANGAGKSTLLMSIFGHPHPRSGQIIFDGQEITRWSSHRIARLGITLVPEGRRIFAAMTVEENLAMGAVPLGRNARQGDAMEQVYQRFPHLWERRRQLAGTLSGGEQQMLAIGRALMSQPRLLLLDEPGLGLAPIVVQQIFAILRDIARAGTTLFLVEQNAYQALHLAHRGYVLANGSLCTEGTASQLLTDPAVRSAYLGL
jgi:branched-chain amino acid transport system ATP-binding protein